MERCSPVQMRKTLELVNTLKKAGIEFIPMPVLNDVDREDLINILNDRLTLIERTLYNG